MGPRGGDELNLVQRGGNYGYPVVSNGDHYGGQTIPDHDTRPDFNAPAVFWNPVISPSSLLFYSGSEFPEWQGDAFIGGLSSQSLVRIEFGGGGGGGNGTRAPPARPRATTCGSASAPWSRGPTARFGCSRRGGRLLKLTAR